MSAPTEHVRVLLVEDDADDAKLLARALARNGMELSLRRVETLRDLEAQLEASRPEIVLSDFRLAGFDAGDVIRVVRGVDERLPIIVVSGTIGEEKAVDLLRDGADDFVIKGSWARLVPAMRRELRKARERREGERLKEELRTRELRLETFVSQVPAILWTVDEELRFQFAVGGAQSNPGGAARGSSLDQLVTPEEVETVMAAHRRALHGERVSYRFSHNDRVFDAHVQPLTDGRGRRAGVIGVALDVTARVHAERALEREQRASALLQETASAANATSTVREVLPIALEIACRHTGWEFGHVLVVTEDEQTLVSSGVVHPPDVSPEFAEVCLRTKFGFGQGLIGAVAATREPLWWVRPDAEKGYLRGREVDDAGFRATVATPILVGDRVVAVMELFHREEIERDEGMLSRLASVGEALGRVFERDRAGRLQRQLLQTQKMEALGRLTGGIAHDFNNLLTVIRLQLEMMRESEALPPELIEDLELARGAADRSADLTRRLLTFSRQSVSEPRVVSLAEVLKDLSAIIRRIIGDRIEIDLALGDVQPVLADVGQLEQVVMNLAVNARDAMPRGGRLTIASMSLEVVAGTRLTRAGARAGRHAALVVSDTGTGIPRSVRDRIFEPFFTTKEEGRGTGLGLSTVHGIVRQHGGAIVVDSEEGRGTTFTIVLPVTTAPNHQNDRPAVLRSQPGGETILLVDDDPLVRRALVRTLSQRGYEVIARGSASEALETLDSDVPVDVILSDVVMPDVTGTELATRVGVTHPELPVILMTGFSPTDLGSDSLRPPPGTVMLSKPFAPEDLAAAIQQALS